MPAIFPSQPNVSLPQFTPDRQGQKGMPDLWDTNSDHVFPTPGEQPDSALSGHDDHSQEVRLRDHRGRLRLPAYILIALVLAVAAIVVLTAVLLP
jgi:hypothetical protein